MVRGNFGWSYAGWLGFFNNEVLMKGNYMKAIRAALLFGTLLFNVSAFALEIKPYSADTFSQLQKSGAKVALHFHAEWCPTCKAQEKVFNSWKGDTSVKSKLNVRTQSTLIVFKGDKEVARLAGKTDEKSLKDALIK